MTQKTEAQELAETEAWLDNLDPDTLIIEDIADLQRLGHAIDTAEAADRELRAAVAACRENGRSWAEIGTSFGVSRQAVQERFSRQPAKAVPAKKAVAKKTAEPQRKKPAKADKSSGGRRVGVGAGR